MSEILDRGRGEKIPKDSTVLKTVELDIFEIIICSGAMIFLKESFIDSYMYKFAQTIQEP